MSEHDLTAAYAVDALTGDEVRQAEQHLAGCAACRAELADLREALADLTAPVEPPAAVRDRVLAALDDVDQLPAEPGAAALRAVPAAVADGARSAPVAPAPVPVVGGDDEVALRRARRRSRTGRWVPAVAAAAAAVLVAAAALGGWTALRWRDQAQQAQQAAAVVAQVAAAPDAVTVAASDGGDGWSSARVVASASLGEAVVVPSGVEPAPRGRTWQLWWVTGEQAPRSAGLLSGATGAPEVLEGAADGATAVAVTLEPAGGSSAPTTTPVAVYPLAA
ncbi:anti-sigma factor [Streptomyces sp. NP160]|uniref:anti-sigma factor n=1 Tax=Streptomyces sp. NP160 TaxID=2586637 RepID=UPI0011188B59|nr:anti-sigma factor [Streptomyces sp. NP160]TNM68039.1 anti-sigma factor [Streptomyces sp. NP160]